MGMPDVDETEIVGAARAIMSKYGDVIGKDQAHNIAYIALVGARGAKNRGNVIWCDRCQENYAPKDRDYQCPQCRR